MAIVKTYLCSYIHTTIQQQGVLSCSVIKNMSSKPTLLTTLLCSFRKAILCLVCPMWVGVLPVYDWKTSEKISPTDSSADPLTMSLTRSDSSGARLSVWPFPAEGRWIPGGGRQGESLLAAVKSSGCAHSSPGRQGMHRAGSDSDHWEPTHPLTTPANPANRWDKTWCSFISFRGEAQFDSSVHLHHN